MKPERRVADPNGPCTCGLEGPDSFGNYDLLEAWDCPIHGEAWADDALERLDQLLETKEAA